jgi:hypothetical protein
MKLEDDTVQRFLDGCFNSGIKRPELFIISKMPQLFGWLKGAFPRGILPTDIDGEVELNGFFLRMEFKHESALRNGRIPKGQHMAMKRLLETGRFTVVFIGTDNKGEAVCYEAWTSKGMRPLINCNQNEIYSFCSRWAAWAQDNTPPKLEQTS